MHFVEVSYGAITTYGAFLWRRGLDRLFSEKKVEEGT